MSLATNVLKTIRDHVASQVALIDGTTDEWTFDIATLGVKHRLRSVEQVCAHEAPEVSVFARRATRAIGLSAASSGSVEVVVFGVVVPDETRWLGLTAADLADLLVTDILKTIEDMPRVSGIEARLVGDPPIDVLIEIDPEDDRWGFVEVTATYETQGTLGT